MPASRTTRSPSAVLAAQLQRAEFQESSELIREARRKQQLTGTKFVGKAYLSEDEQKFIDNFLKKDPIVKGIVSGKKGFRPALERLITRFQALCNRREIVISDSRTKVNAYRLLAIELYLNVSKLKIPPPELVTATLLNSKLIAEIPNERGFKKILREQPGLLRRTLESNPSDVRLDITRRKEAFRELKERGDLSDGYLRRISRGYRNPTKFVERALKECHRLQNLEKLKDLLESRPSLALHAVLEVGVEKAEALLVRMGKLKKRIERDDRLAYYRERPSYILRAIAAHPRNPERHLLDALRRVNRRIRQSDDPSLKDRRASLVKDAVRRPGKFPRQ